MVIQNLITSNKIKNTKEILLLLLKNSLGDRLERLEQNNNKENNNLFSMKETSNNMLNFLKESSQKIDNISYNTKQLIKTDNTIKNNFSKTLKNFYNNNHKIKNKIVSPLSLFSPIKVEKINLKDKIFTNKIKNKKDLSRTPLNSPTTQKYKYKHLKKGSNFSRNINTENNLEIPNNKTNEIKFEKNKKKKIVFLFQSNKNCPIISKQNSVISNKKNTNTNKYLNNKNYRAKTPLSLRNKNIKKIKKLNEITNILTIKKKKNNNKENDFKFKTINNFYQKNKSLINNENRDLSDIKKELDLLCENNLFDNDIRLKQLKLDDFNQTKPKSNFSNKLLSGRRISTLGQSILNNKDELLILDKNISVTLNKKVSKKYGIEENLETCLEYIIEYLPIQDLFNFALINKEYYKTIITYLIKKTETKLEIIKNEINILIKKNPNLDLNIKETTKFECNYNSSRAIVLLNSISKNILFKPNSKLINDKDIIFIFELFFIALGKKQDLIKSENNNSKWNYICKYFKENDKLIGNIIEDEIINKKYSNEIINSLYEWSFKNINKIAPYYYQKINKNIAIFVFIIRDLLDFLGINHEKRVTPQKLFILYNVRKIVQEKIYKDLNKMLDKIEDN